MAKSSGFIHPSSSVSHTVLFPRPYVSVAPELLAFDEVPQSLAKPRIVVKGNYSNGQHAFFDAIIEHYPVSIA
jgi:hypothetical protein